MIFVLSSRCSNNARSTLTQWKWLFWPSTVILFKSAWNLSLILNRKTSMAFYVYATVVLFFHAPFFSSGKVVCGAVVWRIQFFDVFLLLLIFMIGLCGGNSLQPRSGKELRHITICKFLRICLASADDKSFNTAQDAIAKVFSDRIRIETCLIRWHLWQRVPKVSRVERTRRWVIRGNFAIAFFSLPLATCLKVHAI